MPCYFEHRPDGELLVMCGDVGPQCDYVKCRATSRFLCDFPIDGDKTCDVPLCGSHAYEVGPNVHYCPNHFALWQELRAKGPVPVGMENNVYPFKWD